MNLREPGSDKRIQKVYREFVKANEKTLRLWGPIRFMLMEAGEFAPALKRLDCEDLLSFPSGLLAAAFDNRYCQVNLNPLFIDAKSTRVNSTNQQLRWHVDQWNVQEIS